MKLLEGVRRKRLVPACALAAAALGVPAFVALGGGTYGGSDLHSSYLPHAEVHRRAVRETGTLPLWDFSQFGGTPFAGDLLDCPYYPPNVLLLLLPVPAAFEVLIALHLGLAAFGMYRLARSWRLSREAAALAGCAYTLSFMLTARVAAGHFGMVLTLSQAPLLLCLVRRVVLAPRFERLLVLALFAGGIALGGHPPFVYQLGLLAAAFSLTELVSGRGDRPRMRRAAAMLAGAVALAVLLAAANLLPAVEVRAFATRGSAGAGLVYAHNPPDYSLLPRDLASFWIPLYPREHYVKDGAWEYFWHEKAVYVGLVPLLLALFALVTSLRVPAVLFFVLAGVVATADAMARHLPVHGLLTAILPGYDSFRVPARSVWIVSLGACVLAGFGWERWRATGAIDAFRRRFLAVAAGSGVLAVAVLALRFGLRPEAVLFLPMLALAVALLGLTFGVPASVARVALVFTVGELSFQAMGLLPIAPARSLQERPWYLASMGPDPSAYRLLDLTSCGYGYRPALHGVRQMDGLGYPQLQATRALYSSAWEEPPTPSFDRLGGGRRVKDPEPLDLLNVGWVVDDQPPREGGLVEVARRGEAVLYRRPTARPHAFAGPHDAASERSPNTIRVRVLLPAAETLVVSESWMPGWRARIDGRPATVTPYKGALLSVGLPAGRHEVLLTYEPTPCRVGRWVSGLALLGILASWVAPRLRLACGIRPRAVVT